MIDNQHLLPTMNPHQNMIMLMRHKGRSIVKNMTGVESYPLLTLYIVPNYKHHCKFFRLSKCPKNAFKYFFAINSAVPVPRCNCNTTISAVICSGWRCLLGNIFMDHLGSHKYLTSPFTCQRFLYQEHLDFHFI